jgi:dipeptidyl aminopeptidase/acylaminoacyl peptidase
MICNGIARRSRRLRRSLNPSRQTSSPVVRRKRHREHIAFFLATLLLLAGCADDATDRRFANEPLPTVEEAENPENAPTAAASPVPAQPGPSVVSPEALLNARGAPRSFFVSADGRLLVFSADGTAPQELLRPNAGSIAALSSSPNGDRVAVLVADGADRQVIVLDADGEELHRFEDLDELLPAGATPGAEAPIGRDLVDWSPQGDRLLVGFASGGIAAIPLDGEPALVVSPDLANAPTDAEWSPAGDAIAYVNRPPGASGDGLYLVDLGESGAQPIELVAAPTSGGASVVAMAWHPNGRSILYTRTGPTGNASLGGDLFQYTLGQGPRLLASSGVAGPVTGIISFAPSPDGRAVAYVIATPAQGAPGFHSLWVQQIGTDSRMRLATPDGMAVTDLWWTDAGLVMQVEPGRQIDLAADTAEFALFLASGSGVAPAFNAIPAATPESSPVASPVASPEATPVSDDQASPVSQ